MKVKIGDNHGAGAFGIKNKSLILLFGISYGVFNPLYPKNVLRSNIKAEVPNCLSPSGSERSYTNTDPPF